MYSFEFLSQTVFLIFYMVVTFHMNSSVQHQQCFAAFRKYSKGPVTHSPDSNQWPTVYIQPLCCLLSDPFGRKVALRHDYSFTYKRLLWVFQDPTTRWRPLLCFFRHMLKGRQLGFKQKAQSLSSSWGFLQWEHRYEVWVCFCKQNLFVNWARVSLGHIVLSVSGVGKQLTEPAEAWLGR